MGRLPVKGAIIGKCGRPLAGSRSCAQAWQRAKGGARRRWHPCRMRGRAATMHAAVDHTFRLLGHPLGNAVSRFEPVSVPAIPNQDNLTFGRRTRQPHHNPAYGGSGSGGRDHSCSRRLKPHSRSVHPPGSVRT
jgi:hypothetical protein